VAQILETCLYLSHPGPHSAVHICILENMVKHVLLLVCMLTQGLPVVACTPNGMHANAMTYRLFVFLSPLLTPLRALPRDAFALPLPLPLLR
jgi:hypothetical protein